MIIGVTGGLATGTSTAAGYISSCLKAGLISADKIAHSNLKHNRPLVEKMISYFGRDILNNKGAVDRKRLAKKAFANKASHSKLCQAAYPVIISDIQNKIKRLQGRGINSIVIDAPVLVESGFYKECDCIVVVTASLPSQVQRCLFKRITAKDALARVKLQMPLCKKVCYADYIIDNSGNLKELQGRCKKISKNIKQ